MQNDFPFAKNIERNEKSYLCFHTEMQITALEEKEKKCINPVLGQIEV